MKTYLAIPFLVFTFNLYSQSNDDETVWDTITFEENYEYLILDTSNQGKVWQIGNPQKIFFDSAFSQNNAIITDTTNPYPTNCNSHFDILIGDFNYSYDYYLSIFVEFQHKFDTDTLKDGGYITVSYDKGNTWTNILDDRSWCMYPSNSNENLYSENDTLINGEMGFSGNSSDWITTWFSWQVCVTSTKSSNFDMNDTTILRFNFISDDKQTSKEGWIIDNIRLYSKGLIGYIDKSENNGRLLIYPNPVTANSIITLDKQYHDVELEIVDLSGRTMYKNEYKNIRHIEIGEILSYSKGIYVINLILDNKFSISEKISIK